jgi:hypothetical protein
VSDHSVAKPLKHHTTVLVFDICGLFFGRSYRTLARTTPQMNHSEARAEHVRRLFRREVFEISQSLVGFGYTNIRFGFLTLSLCLLVSAQESTRQKSDWAADYRSRTIYFRIADRFNPHEPCAPYEQGGVVLVAVNRGEDATITLPGRVGLANGFHKGLLSNASEVNQGNYISVRPHDSTLHLNGLRSLVVRN